MSQITFRQVSADEARIHDADGDYVGDVFRQADVLDAGQHLYVIHLADDPRGWVRVHRPRSRIRAVAAGASPTLIPLLARDAGKDKRNGGRAWGERSSCPSCSSILSRVLTTATLRVLRSLRSLRPGPRRSKAGRERRRP